MAFDTNRSKSAVFSAILKLMGYNSVNELKENCAVIAGDPNSIAAQTGTWGVNLVLDRTNNYVYARTGAMTSAAATRAAVTYYVRIL